MKISQALCHLHAFFFFILSSHTFSQNLVPNSGFELYDKCPGDYSQQSSEFKVNHWQSASLGTPDYFNTCSVGNADVPHNWAGVSEAHDGQGYVGIYGWMNSDVHYREYLQAKLITPLTKDSTYVIKFRYKLSSYSNYSIDRIGLLLTDSLLFMKHDRVINKTPTLSVVNDSALTKNTGTWETAMMEYRATGREEFIILGNFFDNDQTHAYKIQSRGIAQPMLANSAYYFIDEVEVSAKYSSKGLDLTKLVQEFNLEKTELNKTYVLQNIQFELDSYRLLKFSFEELDRVAAYLFNNPKARVQLSGHTDDQGKADYNIKLSKNRALSTAGYLMSLGIAKNRIETFGYGKNKPLISEVTEQARKINRRVEVRFIQ